MWWPYDTGSKVPLLTGTRIAGEVNIKCPQGTFMSHCVKTSYSAEVDIREISALQRGMNYAHFHEAGACKESEAEVRSCKIGPAEQSKCELCTSKERVLQVCIYEICHDQGCPGEISMAECGCDQIGLSEYRSNQNCRRQIRRFEISSDQICAAQIRTAQIRCG